MTKKGDFQTWENLGANVGASSHPATSRNVGAGTPPPYGGGDNSHVRGSREHPQGGIWRTEDESGSQVRRAA